MVSREASAANFGRYLRTLSVTVRADRGWTVQQFAEGVGVDRQKLWRWGKGDWSQGKPSPETVQQMHTRLGLPWDAAFRSLGWATGSVGPAAPVDLPPEFQALARILRDPRTPAHRRRLILLAVADLAQTFNVDDGAGQQGLRSEMSATVDRPNGQ